MAGKNPIKFTDTTFRDGHQSLLATRMRTEDIVPFMERMDQMGYWAIEVWGGATFDTTHRFLGDDPWERIRTIKGILKKTPTMMLLRGQNLVGYRNYADDLTYRFVRYTAEAGVDIFRVFDALNDQRNWEISVKAIMDAKKEGLMAHFQAAVCYSLTQRRMSGPIFNLDYYVDFAKRAEAMGADSFCLKDMAGIGRPVMLIVGGILIYLAIVKEYEPMLLLPIGAGAILANLRLDLCDLGQARARFEPHAIVTEVRAQPRLHLRGAFGGLAVGVKPVPPLLGLGIGHPDLFGRAGQVGFADAHGAGGLPSPRSSSCFWRCPGWQRGRSLP